MNYGISTFVTSQKSRLSRVERFEKERVGKTRKQVRALECALLSPEEIPPYSGRQPPLSAKKPLFVRSVKFVLPTTKDMELFRKHFNVSDYVETSVANPTFLLRILTALDIGELKYDKEKDTFSCKKISP